MRTILVLIGMFIFNSACQAQENVYATKDGAIKGYDPVAYFTDSAPVKGDKQNAYEWQGATWYFSTPEHLELFKANQEKYAPQYGGFCAYGVANGYKVKIDPEAWAIMDGKLYLNYDLKVQEEWSANSEDYINKANESWIKLIKE